MMDFLRKVTTRLSYGITFFILILVFFLILFWQRMVFVVPAGHAAVIWHSLRASLIGAYVPSEPVGQGLRIIWPWDRFYLYDLRLMTHTETYSVVSMDGLHFEVDMIFRWRVKREQIVEMNQAIGQDYLHALLIPEIGSVLRRLMAQFEAEEIYTTARNQLQDDVYSAVTAESVPNGIGAYGASDQGVTITLIDTLMTNIRLPDSLQQAIERKLAEGELVEEYEIRVQRERLESERKAVEAEGIRRFQETVAPAITDSYLKWRGIEATLALAKSDNAKVVVIGNSDSGLPLILDTGDTASSSIPQTYAPASTASSSDEADSNSVSESDAISSTSTSQ